ncbi:hypothetical protein [Azospirillum isscasi]|uniref:Uncharacterized protein n=1 Tax=Azospirillum isscasi TaxID=3053926 RepID=A0ABU0WLM1_9PROT|nr:hypothetical protein [Azospirillum isscasi]MDQ2105126.1 hypothetical protein [Azospirillum isscasi]
MTLSAESEKLLGSLSCCSYRGDQHTHILVEENDPLAKLKKVTLNAPKGNWFSINPDKGRRKEALMSPLLAVGQAHDHHRACDCVVLIWRDGKLVALYIDLKSGNPVGYSGQFKSTRQFVRYALGLLEEFYGFQLALAEERYVVLYGGKRALINKTPTVPKREGIGKTEPNKPYKREVPNPCQLYLKELLA